MKDFAAREFTVFHGVVRRCSDLSAMESTKVVKAMPTRDDIDALTLDGL